MSKILNKVQEVTRQASGLWRAKVVEGVRVAALGSDLTSVKVKRTWYLIGVAVDTVSRMVVCQEGLEGENAKRVQEWLQAVTEMVGAELLVTDDADAVTHVADEQGLLYHVWKSHAQRNTEQSVEQLQSMVTDEHNGSLRAIGVTPEQALANVARGQELVRQRQPEHGKAKRRVERIGSICWRQPAGVCGVG